MSSERVLVLPMVNEAGELVYRYMTGISSGKPRYFEFCVRWQPSPMPIRIVSSWIRFPATPAGTVVQP